MASLSLVFDLLARDRASAEFRKVGDAAQAAGKHAGGFGTGVSGAMKTAAGAIAAAGIGRAFVGFVKDAQESARISRLTEQVVKSTSGAANVTAQQVNALATAISNKTAVDDEQIQSASNLLLTFTNVRNETGKGNDIFNRATQAAVDMSVAMGTDANGAALQLGKALNDPIKGVTALSRAGVSFTQQQRDQIKAMVEAGDTLGAQKLILGEMQTQFGGAAKAAADPLERLKVVAGNLGERIGGALLPRIEQFATWVSDKAIPAAERFGGWLSRNRDWLIPLAGGLAAVIAAVKAWAIGQAVLNFVLAANPIGLVIIGITALVAAFVLAYRSSDTFRKIVDNAFRVVAATGKWLWENILKPYFTLMWNFWTTVAKGIFWAWENLIKPAWDGVATAAQWLWNNILRPIFSSISSGWGGMSRGFRTVLDTVIKPVFDGFSKVVGVVRDSFRTAVDTIGQVWNGLKDKLRGPVQWVVDVVWNDGLRKLWNVINDLWGGSDISAFRFAGGGVLPISRRGQFADGGVLPGYTPGRDVHTFVSPTGGRLALSGGEAIMRPEFTRALGPANIDLLNRLAREQGEGAVRRALANGEQRFAGGGIISLPGWMSTGLALTPGGSAVSDAVTRISGSGAGGGSWGSMLIGMAKKLAGNLFDKAEDLFFGGGGGSGSGGGGSLVEFGRRLQAMGARVSEHPAFGGVHAVHVRGSKHYSGRAIDVNTRAGTSALEQRELDPMMALARSLGYQVIWRSAGHFNHGHVAEYDRGGLLPPGLTMAYNGTGKPETIRTAEQEAALRGPIDLSDATIDRLAAAMLRGAGAAVGAHSSALGRAVSSRKR